MMQRDTAGCAAPTETVRLVSPRNVATLIVAAFFCALALWLPVEQLTYLVSDDAYYYLNVARNITHGAGSSFDGINPTNGYHPLWMLLLLPVYWLFGNSPEVALRMTLVTQSLILAATLWLAWDVYRQYRANIVSVIVGLGVTATLYSPMEIMFNGLETGLVILVVVALVLADARLVFLGKELSPARQRVFGLLLGLLVLARLDEAFLVVGIAVWSLIREQPLRFAARIRSLLRSYWRTVAVFAAVLAPYFLWNMAEFGHLTPISGTLKSTFPEPVFRWSLLVTYAPWVLLTFLAGMALVPMLRRPDQTVPRANLDLLTGLWIGCLLQVGWAVFFTRWGTFQWHFAAHIPVTCLILSLYAARLRNPAPVAVTSIMVAIALVVVGFNVFVYYDKGDYHKRPLEAAIWAHSATPPNTVFALRDAGLFGYFSERPTINLDGLINSYEFQNYVRDGRLMDFLRERGVTSLADAYSSCSYSERHVWIRSYPPHVPAEVAYGLTVDRHAEVYRSAATIFRPITDRRRMCFVIWPFNTVWLEVRGAAVDKSVQR